MHGSKNVERYQDSDRTQTTPVIRNMITGVSEKMRCSKFSRLNTEGSGSPKRWHLSSKLHDVISGKNVILDSFLVPDSSKLTTELINLLTAIRILCSMSLKLIRRSKGYACCKSIDFRVDNPSNPEHGGRRYL